MGMGGGIECENYCENYWSDFCDLGVGGGGGADRIEGEAFESIHVVNVHPDHVAGDALLTECACHLATTRKER